jgi:hypothetical protein
LNIASTGAGHDCAEAAENPAIAIAVITIFGNSLMCNLLVSLFESALARVAACKKHKIVHISGALKRRCWKLLEQNKKAAEAAFVA